MRSLPALALLVGLLACGESAVGACTFLPPQGWNSAVTRWDGECPGGRAEGLGVLKEYQGNKVTRFYFGRMKAGEAELGVIDQESGYIAGRFAGGRVIPSGERQVVVDAFAEAEKSARGAAERFARAGNKASSSFYQDKARQLREQLD